MVLVSSFVKEDTKVIIETKFIFSKWSTKSTETTYSKEITPMLWRITTCSFISSTIYGIKKELKAQSDPIYNIILKDKQEREIVVEMLLFAG